MVYTKQGSMFQPVVLFTPETEADRLALKMVYHLHDEVRATMNTERSKQQSIGISEIGGDCRRCVARKLSGLYVKPFDPSWKAQVGTFIHAGLEEHFAAKYGNGPDQLTVEQQRVVDLMGAVPAGPGVVPTDEHPVYYMERHLHLLTYKSLELGGSCDLYIEGATFGLVCDWKTQGPAKLKRTAAAHISTAYRVQMPSYGLAWELLGHLVTHVVLFALPRDGELNDAKPVLMRYDKDVAIQALAGLQVLIDAAEIVGWPAVIATQDRAGQCFDCADYEKLEAAGFLEDLTA